MNHPALFTEELKLDQIRETSQQLLLMERELTENKKRIALERIEQETTMPPLDEIEARRRRKRHEEIVSRGQVINTRREQSRSLLMLLALVAATGSLIWWGVSLMQGT